MQSFTQMGGKDNLSTCLTAQCTRAVVEFVIVSGQGAAILKLNAPFIDTAHFCQLAVCGAESRLPTIPRQQEPVSGSHFNFMALMHRERARL